MLTTPQQTAKWLLEQPETAHFFSRAERRHLFSVESWPEGLPLRTQDVLRTVRLYNRFREAFGL